jgi:hypothetical protein
MAQPTRVAARRAEGSMPRSALRARRWPLRRAKRPGSTTHSGPPTRTGQARMPAGPRCRPVPSTAPDCRQVPRPWPSSTQGPEDRRVARWAVGRRERTSQEASVPRDWTAKGTHPLATRRPSSRGRGNHALPGAGPLEIVELVQRQQRIRLTVAVLLIPRARWPVPSPPYLCRPRHQRDELRPVAGPKRRVWTPIGMPAVTLHRNLVELRRLRLMVGDAPALVAAPGQSSRQDRVASGPSRTGRGVRVSRRQLP